MSADAELAPYFTESRSWDADRAAQFRRSARLPGGLPVRAGSVRSLQALRFSG